MLDFIQDIFSFQRILLFLPFLFIIVNFYNKVNKVDDTFKEYFSPMKDELEKNFYSISTYKGPSFLYVCLASVLLITYVIYSKFTFAIICTSNIRPIITFSLAFICGILSNWLYRVFLLNLLFNLIKSLSYIFYNYRKESFILINLCINVLLVCLGCHLNIVSIFLNYLRLEYSKLIYYPFIYGLFISILLDRIVFSFYTKVADVSADTIALANEIEQDSIDNKLTKCDNLGDIVGDLYSSLHYFIDIILVFSYVGTGMFFSPYIKLSNDILILYIVGSFVFYIIYNFFNSVKNYQSEITILTGCLFYLINKFTFEDIHLLQLFYIATANLSTVLNFIFIFIFIKEVIKNINEFHRKLTTINLAFSLVFTTGIAIFITSYIYGSMLGFGYLNSEFYPLFNIDLISTSLIILLSRLHIDVFSIIGDIFGGLTKQYNDYELEVYAEEIDTLGNIEKFISKTVYIMVIYMFIECAKAKYLQIPGLENIYSTFTLNEITGSTTTFNFFYALNRLMVPSDLCILSIILISFVYIAYNVFYEAILSNNANSDLIMKHINSNNFILLMIWLIMYNSLYNEMYCISLMTIAIFFNIKGALLDCNKKYMHSLSNKTDINVKSSIVGDIYGDPLKDIVYPILFSYILLLII